MFPGAGMTMVSTLSLHSGLGRTRRGRASFLRPTSPVLRSSQLHTGIPILNLAGMDRREAMENLDRIAQPRGPRGRGPGAGVRDLRPVSGRMRVRDIGAELARQEGRGLVDDGGRSAGAGRRAAKDDPAKLFASLRRQFACRKIFDSQRRALCSVPPRPTK